MKMEATEFERRQKIGQLTHTGQQHIEQEARENAIDCFLNAYQLSRQVGDDQLERTCALNLGAAYIELGQAAEGLKILHKATPPDGEKDGISNGDLYYNFALGHQKVKNLKEAVKYYQLASDEFRTDPDMQIQCLTKCAHLFSEWKNYSKVIEVYERMCNVYRIHEDSVMQASTLCEIAATHRLTQNDAAAGKVADEVFKLLSKVHETDDGASNKRDMAGKIFNDLGLVYTQLQNYDMACSCFENALPLVRAPTENKQLEAVILQNLGAAYNFRGDYQRAVKFHEDAADAYGKIKIRNSQGQCFINLAFAYSQMGNIDEADVAFNHALLASKDAGDRQTRWQALEGLGSVKFNQGKYEKAETFFLDALRLIPDYKEEASERVKQKLAMVMKMKVLGGQQSLPRHNYQNYTQGHVTAMDTQRLQHMERQIIQEPAISPTHAPVEGAAPTMPAGEQPLMSSARQAEDYQQQIVEAVAQQKRFVPVRKKDSVGHRHHPKMMRGLSGTFSSMSNYDSPRYVDHVSHRSGVLADVEESGSESSEEEEESSSTEEESSSEEEESTTKEEKIDKRDGGPKTGQNQEVSPLVEEIFRPSTETLQKTSPDSRQLPVHRADKDATHRQYEKMLLEKEENEDKISSDDEIDGDSDDDSDEEETSSSSGDESKPESEDEETEEEKKTKEEPKEKLPVLPTQSPPHTSGFSSGDVATYLKPLSTQGKPYDTADMAPYLDTGVVPAFYNTEYTPVPYDDVAGTSQSESDPTEISKKNSDVPGPSKGENGNLPFSSSGDIEDPQTLYSTVNKTKKNKEPVTWYQSSENGNPDIKVEKMKKLKREKSGNYFDSDESISGDDIDVTNKMKEVASNMSLRGSIRPGSGEEEEDPYQSINDVTRGTGEFQHVQEDEADRLKGIDEMPRGQREALLVKEHARRSELGPPLPERSKQAKESKTCVIM